MMKSLFLSLILTLVVCCATKQEPSPIYDAIDVTEGIFAVQYEFVDIPSEQRIEISFYNRLDQAVCFHSLYWPDRSGVMDLGSKGITIIIGQQRFTTDMTTPEYCPGCAKVVAPGETLRVSIRYEAFHLPEALFNEKKSLEFFPMAYRCITRK